MELFGLSASPQRSSKSFDEKNFRSEERQSIRRENLENKNDCFACGLSLFLSDLM